MKGSKQVIDVLNGALAAELLAVSQYFMHSRLNKNRGFFALANEQQAEAREEMEHAGLLTDRILLLGGTPNPRMKETPNVGRTVPEQMKNDLALQQRAVKRLNDGIATARQKGDNGSADLLATILHAEEDHVHWLETQLSLIQKLGEANYLQTQLGPAAAPAAAPAARD